MTDPRLHAVVQTAIARIADAMRGASQRSIENMDRMLLSGVRSDAERFVWQLAVQDLRRKLQTFNAGFAEALRDLITTELASRGGDAARRFEETDWRSLSLVADGEVDQKVSVDRLTRELSTDCEWELRELDAYVLAAQRAGHGERQRNPLRPEVLAKALVRSAEAICDDKAARPVLMREVSRALSTVMRGTYATITDDLRRQGIEPIGLTVRTVEGPGTDITRETAPDSGYQTLRRDPRPQLQQAQSLGAMFGMPVPSGFAATGPGDDGNTQPQAYRPSGWPATGSHSQPGGYGTAPGPGTLKFGDAQMLDVIRRLAQVASMAPEPAGWQRTAAASGPGTSPGGYGGGPGGGGPGGGGLGAGMGGMGPGGVPTAFPGTVPGTSEGDAVMNRMALPGLMDLATGNLIRLHRDELQRAATGSLDHMVIDIVAALFDQVLADPNIPPQMARQIGRLQLPVLRVALKDMGFFNSRRHPVRRFVNRIATLAVAFDDLDEGHGREFLEKVRRLVQDIIEGDFDQMGLYEAKLLDLEALVAEQSASKSSPHAEAAAVLDGKENMLRVQQRYTLALKEQLQNVVAEDFARDFLSQVWSQVVVLTTMRDGPNAPLTQRMKLAGRDLVLSLQPKGTPQERKEFLVKLPQMMRDLNEGLNLIRWADAAKKDFFSKLLPAHAQSLKATPMTDFAMRQLRFQLDQVDKVPIPKPGELPVDTSPAALMAEEAAHIPIAFTDEEARRVGLVDETRMDTEGNVDIDLGDEANTAADTEAMPIGEGLDVDLDVPAAPNQGVQLIHHMQPGCAYLMHIDKRGWRKVRLSWVSPGRGFFVFSHGRKQTKTISMTARMLTNMLNNSRFRAFEQSELIERATARARRQLASLSTAVKH